MLRDEKTAAVDDVIVALKQAADAYADAAEIVRATDAGLADRLVATATRRDAMAAELERLYRREGELPSDPDTEAETVQQVVRHIKAALGNEVAVAREEARAREAGLIGTIQAAIALEVSEADLLRRFLDEIGPERIA